MTTATTHPLSALAAVRPGSLRAWVLACRPATLTAAVTPVLLGTAVAHASGHARVGPALVTAAAAIAIQFATNFANDVFDHEKGADTAARLGPTRATQAGLLTAAQLRRGMLVSVAVAAALGLWLAAVGGWPILLIGALSIASGIAYTAGPFPLGYHGLGDAFVFVFFGLVAVAGTAFVQTGGVPALVWPAGVAAGALATAVLVVNNLRDRVTDAAAGKRTLAVRFGARAVRLEYALLVAVAYVAAAVAAWLVGAPYPLLAFVTAPSAARRVALVSKTDGRDLNVSLAATARLLFAFGAALALGIAMGRFGA